MSNLTINKSSDFDRYLDECSSFAKTGWRIIKHPISRDMILAVASVALLVGGVAVTFFVLPKMAPTAIKLFNGEIQYFLNFASHSSLLKTAALIAAGGVMMGAGGFGCLAFVKKPLTLMRKDLKHDESWLKEKMRNEIPVERAISNFILITSKVLETARMAEKSRMGKFLITAAAIGVLIVGLATLAVTGHYFASLYMTNVPILVGYKMVHLSKFRIWVDSFELAIYGLVGGGALTSFGFCWTVANIVPKAKKEPEYLGVNVQETMR